MEALKSWEGGKACFFLLPQRCPIILSRHILEVGQISCHSKGGQLGILGNVVG